MFLDSDDKITKGAIDKLLDIAFDKNLDIIEGGMIRIDENSKEIFKRKKETSFFYSDIGRLSGFVGGKIVKNRVFEKIRFPLEHGYEDSIFAWLIFPQHYYVGNIEDDIYI